MSKTGYLSQYGNIFSRFELRLAGNSGSEDVKKATCCNDYVQQMA